MKKQLGWRNHLQLLCIALMMYELVQLRYAQHALAAEKAKKAIKVFVPCGMSLPFYAVKEEFERRTNCSANLVFDNAVVLLRRIRRGECPDVLITPGELEMSQMVSEGYIDKETVRTFGTFDLVLVVPKGNRANVRKLSDLVKPSVKTIGIADWKLNSAGYYAKLALERAGLWEKVRGKLVKHWHALKAAEFVCTGRVDVGIYYATCPFESGPEKLEEVGVQVEEHPYQIVARIPNNLYPPVKVQAGVLKKAPNKNMALKFVSLLLDRKVQSVLAKRGIPNYRPMGGHKQSRYKGEVRG
ncbi:MAG: molybdate ABC transporter substrate-binding protein [Armatimonadota bacterium]|nr:molybdate ABC transporter substrate-binding protein [Armatimonadota bacterium]MCX7777712.1 molybdate ABC transporter substrate-binding protein [Armatimonadota bacterium]MDW8025873.1 molybdate ABC transporter substrate-binding protein [Armatimonadota bacterium]